MDLVEVARDDPSHLQIQLYLFLVPLKLKYPETKIKAIQVFIHLFICSSNASI